MRLGLLFLLCACGASCSRPDDSAQRRGRVEQTSADNLAREALLEQMPLNTHNQCFGIALVLEAALDSSVGESGECPTLSELAKGLYDDFLNMRESTLPESVAYSGRRLHTTSKEAMAALSSEVAKLYKEEFERLTSSDPGKKRLADMEFDVIKSRAELFAILHEDPDHTAMFFFVGMREFPDGSIRPSNHVALLQGSDDNGLVVYDSNDPGHALLCQLEEVEDGIQVYWTCAYRDAGTQVTQLYHVISKDKFVRAVNLVK